MADEKFVTFLRAMADFYEAHPLVPQFTQYTWSEAVDIYLDRAKAKEILRSIGSFDKEFVEDRMLAKKEIGGRIVSFSVARDAVCVAKVVGKKHVDTQIIPESYIPSQTIAAHVEDVI